jgi:PAS domain-containing protein
MADFYAGLHPDDRAHTTAAFAAAMDPSQRILYDVEYRKVGKEDGVIRWVAAKGRALFDEDGRRVRVLGTAIDITARKAAETSLRESEARLRVAMNALKGRRPKQGRVSSESAPDSTWNCRSPARLPLSTVIRRDSYNCLAI